MTASCTVAVATYGDPAWQTLAEARAIPSAQAQGAPVIHVHGPSLHEARNACLDQVDTPHVVFLDADDELEAGYLHAMAQGTADVRVPSVRYVGRAGTRGQGASHRRRLPTSAGPVMLRVAGHRHQCTGECLPYGNWIVIGAMARVDVLRKVGGFEDYPWSEDWALWSRAWQAGATFEPIPAAVYRAHVRRDSRNRAPDHAAKLAAHRAIAEALGFPQP